MGTGTENGNLTYKVHGKLVRAVDVEQLSEVGIFYLFYDQANGSVLRTKAHRKPIIQSL